MPAMFRFRRSLRDGYTWAGCTMGVTIAPDPIETWSYDTDLNTLTASGVDIATSFVTWANDGARAWTGAASFSWEAVPYDVAAYKDAFGAGITVTCTVSATWTPGGDTAALMGWISVVGGTELVSDTAIVGSVGGNWGVMAYENAPRPKGIVSNAGGYTTTGAKTAPKRPTVEAVLGETQVIALSDARMLIRGGRRQVHFWQDYKSKWRLLDTGRINTGRVGPNLYRVRPQVLG